MRLLRLVNEKGTDAPLGSLAIELPWGYSQDDVLELIEQAGEYAKEFIYVTWVEGKGRDGYYHELRFERVKDVIRA